MKDLLIQEERVLNALDWAIDAYSRRALSDKEFSEILEILDNEFTEVREVIYKRAK